MTATFSRHDSVLISVPCYGAVHRVRWMRGKSVQLLDHDSAHYRMERRLAMACGDTDFWRWLDSPHVPPAGCFAVLDAMFHMFRGHRDPTWLILCGGGRDLITASNEAEAARRAKTEAEAAQWTKTWPAAARRLSWQQARLDSFSRVRFSRVRFVGAGLFGRNVQ